MPKPEPTSIHSVAAEMLASGSTAFRHSVTGQPRAPLCGMGICYECRSTVAGVHNVMTCQSYGNEKCSPLRLSTHDILIVGGGPAGMAAAVRASESGRSVAVVDDNSDFGGQIWRNDRQKPSSTQAAVWFDRIAKASINLISGTRIVSKSGPNTLLGERNGEPIELSYDQLILATGARELFLPFPGWTLPNVMGAGGLQALVKAGLPIEGKRVLIAGSGPLLVAVAAYLKSRKADVLMIAEQAPTSKLLHFGVSIAFDSDKRRQAIDYQMQIRGVPYRRSTWPIEANGHEKLESVTLTNGSRTFNLKCDYLACGFGLVPNTELAQLLVCKVEEGRVLVNSLQQTDQPGIFCVGESTGIGGLECGLIEGEIAGLVATGLESDARRLQPKRTKARKFADVLASSFQIREELKSLAKAETLVCRCEDVAYGNLAKHHDFTSAKIQTRCGMGPCQARVCGAALNILFGWDDISVRPPLAPVTLKTLGRVYSPRG